MVAIANNSSHSLRIRSRMRLGTAAMNIRGYESGDEQSIVQLWNSALRNDPINMPVFERKILLEPNFDPRGCILAFESATLVGYAQCMVRRYPNYHDGLEQGKGWITVFMAGTPAVGDAVLRSAGDYFAAKGANQLWFSGFTPNYFWPGIDASSYPHLHKMLLDAGYVDASEALAMDAPLWPEFRLPPDIDEIERRLEKEGIVVRSPETADLVSLLDFLRTNFSADWYRHCLDQLSAGASKSQFTIAVRGREVLGYAQFWDGDGYDWWGPGEHFGPFGVKESQRGKGLGSVILKRTLENMRKSGSHHAFFLWTDRRAARLYERFGFRVSRRFTVMRKEVAG